MVSNMKLFTQIAYLCVSLVLSFAAAHSFAEMTNNEQQTEVSEILIPLSQDTIKQQANGPKRGMSMQAVEAEYGKAMKIHPTTGKPPITRWDYSDFSVYFESNFVIHTVHRNP